jgi:tRNA U34 2-thiouridine synthase MnmA/TrmU
MTNIKRVAVAMSGGVDSSVAAALLVESGVETFGLMMRLWSADPKGYNRCCSPEDVALAMGATHLATGHYARVKTINNRHSLLRGLDVEKDQSYVLSFISEQDLSHTLFPLGGYTKKEVRKLAHRMSLSVAEKPESQDLCFITSGNYRDFLRQQEVKLPPPGPIIDQHHRSEAWNWYLNALPLVCPQERYRL